MTKFEKQVIEKLGGIEELLSKNLQHSDIETEKEEKDVFTDPRDGKKYPFKELPDGKIWLMENLRFEVEDAVWNKEYNCYMYTWEQAKEAVPEGFHLPTAKEFHDLCFALGYLEKSDEEVAKRLMSECGFVLSGGCNSSRGLLNQGSYMYSWSSTQGNTNYAYLLDVAASSVNPGTNYGSKYLGLPVRCIKN